MTAARRRTTTALAAVVVGVLAALPLLLAAPPAQASTYRYWTYWWAASNTAQGTSGWRFSSVGPAGHRVNDTWVLGWRFSTTTSTTGGAKPRASSEFATLCPTLAPAAGKDRVAVVVDYGTSSDAPPGQRPPTTTTVRVECKLIDSHPTGLTVLTTDQRGAGLGGPIVISSKNGLVCSLDGYPKGECAPLVADPTPTPTATKKPTPTARATSSGPAVPVTGRSATPTSGGSTTAPAASTTATPGAATTSAAATSSGSTAAEPADEPTLQAASGAPTGDTASKAGPGSPVATVLGTAAVVALAGAAFWISRRRS